MKKTLYNILGIYALVSCFYLGAEELLETPAYQAKDFSLLLGHVMGLSDALLSMHFKLYEGYVKNTNLLIQALMDMREKGEENSIAFGALKRRIGWEYDGMRLHELYFETLGQPEALSTKSLLYKAIVRDFGSYEAWKKDFIATGLIRGIGWVILYRDPIQKRLLNVWINEHDLGHLAGGTPLLVMDVWEHAYITEYGLERAKYIKVFLEDLNWSVVSKRFRRAQETHVQSNHKLETQDKETTFDRRFL